MSTEENKAISQRIAEAIGAGDAAPLRARAFGARSLLAFGLAALLLALVPTASATVRQGGIFMLIS